MPDKEKNKINPLHITQAFGIDLEENDLDFFDANLYYDSLLFIDPFLFRTSPEEKERELFKRFGDFFKLAYDKSLEAKSENDYRILKRFLNFKEIPEVYLGYTKASNKGSGPAGSLAESLINFFLKSSAHRLITNDNIYPDKQFNPDILPVITEKIGPDGISDLSANLMMDYFIEYTHEQCKKHGIEIKKTLPISQFFDFKESEWTNGRYYKLPENPLRPGEPIVFVPKRLLRMGEKMEADKAKSKIIGILREDPDLNKRFSSLVSKQLKEITIEEIKDALLQEESIITRYLKAIEREGIDSYDFNKDVLEILAIKKFSKKFKDLKPSIINNCQTLLHHTQNLTNIFDHELSRRDGWREMWYTDEKGTDRPCKEESFGRLFRGMGHAYFDQYKEVTFLAEAGTGNGYVDFYVAFKDCKITIELKRLSNSTATGEPPLPAYIHGILRQLPDYSIEVKAKYAFYITGQHYKKKKGSKLDHSKRVLEIQSKIAESEAKIKAEFSEFQKMHYINIDLSPKPSSSKK